GGLADGDPSGHGLVGAVEFLDRGHRRPALLTHRGGHRLGVAQHTKGVVPGQLAEVGVGPATGAQLVQQRRVTGYVGEPLRRAGDAVEVTAKPDMVDTRDGSYVFDVVGDVHN